MQIIGNFFGWIMFFCYKLARNYGLTIVLFTFVTKIVLLPISIMVQKNSIKMVKMYPEMNRIKAKYFGNKDMISEEQYNLYKREHYHPMLDLVPVVLQLIILMGVIDVIYKPLRYLLKIEQGYIDTIVSWFSSVSGISEEVGSIQVQLVNYLQGTGSSLQLASSIPENIITGIQSFNMSFLGLNLGTVPINSGGMSIVIPVLAALSSWLMCVAQNHANVLQSEQGKLNKITTLLLSVGLSLYLGFFVPAGVGFYWTVSNLMSIALLYILNYFINPKDYIDYTALEASKKELEDINQYSLQSKGKEKSEFSTLEKNDYRRFEKFRDKQIVFYSEGKGFYKYFQNVIELIEKKTDIIIHYVTSDPHDEVFQLQSDNFQVYYIGENKLIVLMMKMDADMVVMTMPDLQKYHIKRSMVRDDIEYVYMDHGIGSINLMLRKHALDYFDTIFASNDIVCKEIRAQEKLYGLKEKKIIQYGFGLIDNMIANYGEQPEVKNDPKVILIAPSWQESNMLDLCIDEILEHLLGQGYHIILRPHPQYVRHFKSKLLALEAKYSGDDDFTLQTDFSSNDTVFNADILMTDWSGIAYEYSFTTLKPALFINTPMKVMNPDYEEIGVIPFDIEIRNRIGLSVELGQLDTIADVVDKLLNEENYKKDEMRKLRDMYLYNVTNSAEVGANYIINRLIEISKA